ncbi:MAG TPA: OsmC family protein [Gemmatimonadales bacterium]|jgi:osmotically inducible protein OsmC|nr:OsmC family protein [Gemmatimonadales bacterium]
MERTAEARWQGALRDGQGTLRLGSGAFEGKYSFSTRFEGAPGTNPEELLGAAHAGCFSMALAHGLAQAGHPPTSLETKATVHLDKAGAGFAITSIDLDTRAEVPALSNQEFQSLVEQAKTGCVMCQALRAVPVRLRATLTGAQ